MSASVFSGVSSGVPSGVPSGVASGEVIAVVQSGDVFRENAEQQTSRSPFQESLHDLEKSADEARIDLRSIETDILTTTQGITLLQKELEQKK